MSSAFLKKGYNTYDKNIVKPSRAAYYKRTDKNGNLFLVVSAKGSVNFMIQFVD